MSTHNFNRVLIRDRFKWEIEKDKLKPIGGRKVMASRYISSDPNGSRSAGMNFIVTGSSSRVLAYNPSIVVEVKEGEFFSDEYLGLLRKSWIETLDAKSEEMRKFIADMQLEQFQDDTFFDDKLKSLFRLERSSDKIDSNIVMVDIHFDNLERQRGYQLNLWVSSSIMGSKSATGHVNKKEPEVHYRIHGANVCRSDFTIIGGSGGAEIYIGGWGGGKKPQLRKCRKYIRLWCGQG